MELHVTTKFDEDDIAFYGGVGLQVGVIHISIANGTTRISYHLSGEEYGVDEDQLELPPANRDFKNEARILLSRLASSGYPRKEYARFVEGCVPQFSSYEFGGWPRINSDEALAQAEAWLREMVAPGRSPERENTANEENK